MVLLAFFDLWTILQVRSYTGEYERNFIGMQAGRQAGRQTDKDDSGRMDGQKHDLKDAHEQE